MIVLDTHAVIWWVSGDDRLSPAARQAIDDELSDRQQLLISAVSAWEIAMLIENGRLVLTMDIGDWLATVEAIEGVVFVPVDQAMAVQSVRLLGEFHPDPADRMIVALARHHAGRW